MTDRTDDRVDLVLEALAVYRATKLLQDDQLPPLPAVRERLMQRWGASPWSMLIDCPWCLSVWLGGVSVLARHLTPRLWRVLASVLASSAVAGVISEWLASMQLPEVVEAVESMERATATINEATDVLSREYVVMHRGDGTAEVWPSGRIDET